MSTLTFGSLFSGIGGFDLALERAGLRGAWQVEIDDDATRVLARHWPAVARYGDVRACGRSNLGPVDLICGGFPCQDVSVAGRRAGLAGARSGLWWEFRRVLDECRPRWVVIENVPGLLSSNGGADFAAVLCGLVECGYRCAWRILDAQYFGLAQRRRRVFLVGYLGDGRAAEVLFERTGGAGDTPSGGAPGPGIAAMLTGGASGGSSHGKPNGSDRRELVLAGALSASHGGADDNEAQAGQLVATAITASAGHHGHSSPRGDGSDNLLVAPAIAYTVHGEYSTAMTGNGNAAVAFRTERARNLDTTGGYASSQGGTVVQQPVGVRRLTPRECERLQGFPDDWTADQSDSTRYRQLGNAVAVPVVEWIARRVLAADRSAA